MAAVAKPLAFAARDDFAHQGRVRDLAATVGSAADRAAALAVPKDAREALGAIARRFSGGAEADPAAIAEALARLEKLLDPAYGEAALGRSPAVLPGIAEKRAQRLARRGLSDVSDLLFELPTRYDDRRRLSRVAELEVGRRATFAARVLVSDFVARRGRGGRPGRSFEAVVGDDSGTLRLKWFNGSDAIAAMARKDAQLLVTGDVTRYRFDKQILHPEIETIPDDALVGDIAQRHPIVPVYAAREGLHPRALRRLIEHALAGYADLVGGFLPDSLVREHTLPSPADALREIHRPAADADVEALRSGTSRAHRRLVLEELYLLELGLALRRAEQRRETAAAIPAGGPRVAAAEAALPFELTGAQRRAWREIAADLAESHPMSRLLEGDVGSGKTVVAYLAAVAAAERGFQTAIMAPTELLAEQHARTLAALVGGDGEGTLRLALLTASLPRAEAEAVRRGLADGSVDLVVGTHALVQEGVRFSNLALAVIDEQHRFGVRQRAALAAKAEQAPHTLVMTATPIPRTLALTLHGDLDLSVIDELPPGRKPTRTLLVREGEGRRVSELLRETVSRGEQAYVVYPLVEESEKVDLRAASESAARIASAFPEFSVDLVHGQQPAAERAAAMARFAAGETQVLVSTSVIEVGVDVPNATLMVIEHAERFGLAQLHQLRGRVGRGAAQATCVCVARGVTEDSEARLQALLSTGDGFEIAEADLQIRGPGEFLGTRQSGQFPDLRIANLTRDARLIPLARSAAQEKVRRDPRLARSPELALAVKRRWGDRLAVVGVG